MSKQVYIEKANINSGGYVDLSRYVSLWDLIDERLRCCGIECCNGNVNDPGDCTDCDQLQAVDDDGGSHAPGAVVSPIDVTTNDVITGCTDTPTHILLFIPLELNVSGTVVIDPVTGIITGLDTTGSPDGVYNIVYKVTCNAGALSAIANVEVTIAAV